MKLSEIKGERTFDVIAAIIEPISNIAKSKEGKELFRKEKLPSGADKTEFAAKRLKAALPPLLKAHKSDIISILAAIEGVSVEEYTKQLDLFKLTKDCTDLLTDKSFISLFPSAQSKTTCGSAQGNTTGQKV